MTRAPIVTLDACKAEPETWAQPRLVLGFASNWPASTLWDDGYLDRAVGDNLLLVEASSTPMFTPEIAAAGFPKRRMALRDFMDGSAHQRPEEWLYAAQIPLQGQLAAIAQDITHPAWIAKAPSLVSFWMGRAATGTRMHYDPYDNVMAVVRGSKVFSLLPPGRFANMYPYPAYSRWGHFSRVDAESVDSMKFPRYPARDILTCRVEAGQAICIPTGWWHQVKNDGMTVAVNFFYSPGFPRNCNVPGLRFLVGKAWRKRHPQVVPEVGSKSGSC
jgi:hypothetical protein